MKILDVVFNADCTACVLMLEWTRGARPEGGSHQLCIELHGDCCSSSFFDDESVAEVGALRGERLVSLESVAGPEPVVHDFGETQFCALHFKTERSSITATWRNESNGHYSGWAIVAFDGREVWSEFSREVLRVAELVK